MQVVIADRNATMRLGIRTLFNQQLNGAEVAEVSSRTDLMNYLRIEDHGLVVIDPLMCGGSGESLIRQIRELAPGANILVYTDLDELKFGLHAIRWGAKGYVMKSSPTSELLAAANRVGAGKVHISQALAEEFAINMWHAAEDPHETLSERELQVFAMLVGGRTVTGIASTLHLSIKTISTHKSRAMQKLRCKNLTDLIDYAYSHDLKAECEARCAGF